jgi:hypothetical protein
MFISSTSINRKLKLAIIVSIMFYLIVLFQFFHLMKKISLLDLFLNKVYLLDNSAISYFLKQ